VPAPAPRARSFEASYVATVQEVPAGLARLEGWIPVPSDSPEQTVRNVRVDSPYPGEIRREKEHGDRYFYFSTDAPKSGPLDIRVRFEAERREAGPAPSAESPADLQRYLQAESLVTISPRIREI